MRSLLLRRRMMMPITGGGGILPPGYQQVEYLENLLGTYSTTGIKPGGGGCYIDTGIYPELDDEVEIVFEAAADFYNQYVSPFAEYSNNMRNFGIVLQRATTYYLMGNQKSYGGVTWVSSTKYRVILNKTSLTRDGMVLINYDGVSSGFTSPSTMPIYLFCNSFDEASPYYNALYVFKGKIYEFIFRKNGVLTNHFIPCYRNGDTTDAGFYDIVTDTFHGDASGQNGFIVGPLV